MIDGLAALIVGEGNWLPLAMAIALAAATAQWIRRSRLTRRERIMGVMNLFVGVTLLVMGVGHLLAVTTKLWQGTLNGSPALLYAIGAAIVVPSALIAGTGHRPAAAFNGWMAATLVLLGPINIPLAIPPLLNLAYSRHARARTGVAIVVVFVLVNLGLLAGGLVFLLSGARTFEEFQRMG